MGGDVGGEGALGDADVAADLDEGDAAFGNETARETFRRAETLGHLGNGQIALGRAGRRHGNPCRRPEAGTPGGVIV